MRTATLTKKPNLRLVGYDGKFELGIAEFEDVYQDNTQSIDKPKAIIKVPANIRCDVFMYLRQHDKIDRHHWTAGMRLSGYMERLTRSAPAIDTTREPVDGRGGAKDPFLATLEARRAIDDVRAELGRRDFTYVTDVINDPFTWITLYMNCGPWHKRKLVDRVRGILEILSGHFGYAGGRE
jgi:hypothetical protein